MRRVQPRLVRIASEDEAKLGVAGCLRVRRGVEGETKLWLCWRVFEEETLAGVLVGGRLSWVEAKRGD